MKSYLKFISLIFFVIAIFSGKVNATNYIWTGTTSTDWNTTTNWTPNGLPDSLDNVTISTTTNSPVLSQNRKVNNLTMTADSLNLGTYMLTFKGTGTFTSGIIYNGTLQGRASAAVAAFNGTKIDCVADIICGYIRLSGSTFTSTAYFEDNGFATGTGTGGCTFNGNVTIKHTGSGTYFTLGNTTGDTFNADLTVINTSTHEVNLATSGTTNYNGNIILNNTNTGGIFFGGTTGSSVLATGKTISIGGSGFTKDYLTLQRFTQLGTTSQILTLTDTANVNMIACVFNGALTVSAPGFLCKSNTYNGTTSLTKTGTANQHSDGGNTFNGNTTISNTGTGGRIRFATNNQDIFNGNVTFESTGQDVQIAYNGNNYFYGNITINSVKVVFNTSTGRVTFAGSNSQSLNGSYNYAFKKVTLNKSSNHVTANTTLSVDDSLYFSLGNLITTSTNLLTMKAGSKVLGANNASFVHGPIKKVGNTSFIFPTGKSTNYRAIEITTPLVSSDAFTAEFIENPQTNGSNMDTSLVSINTCDYWILSRTAGSSNVKITLHWNNNTCNISYPNNSRVSNWNGIKWVDLGNDIYNGTIFSGYVKGLNNPSLYGAFCLANKGSAYSGAPRLTIVNNYSMLANDSIFSDSTSFGFGKIGAKANIINILSNDSILLNNSGSVSSAIDTLVNAIFYANSLNSSDIGVNFNNDTLYSGVYHISGNSIFDQTLTLLGDSTSIFIFNISGSLTVDSGATVNLGNVRSYNVYWIVNNTFYSNQLILFPGIILCKNRLTSASLNYGQPALYSLADIRLFTNFDLGNNSYNSIYNQILNAYISPSACNFTFDGCNNILNSTFEYFLVPPNAPFINLCPWNNLIGSLATPDYHSSFGNTTNDIPNNFQGCQLDNYGPDGYTGIFAYQNGIEYREYIQSQLNSPLAPLINNQTYYAEMFVSLAERSALSINTLGLYFSINPVSQSAGAPVIVSPQIQSPITTQLNDKINWVRISGCFIGQGENFVTIGNFNNDLNTVLATSTQNPACNFNMVQQSYYYIDDPAVVPFSVNAGADQTVECDATIQLGLSTCINNLNTGQFTYLWSQLAGPPLVLSNTSIFNPTFVSSNSTGSPLTCVFQVTLTSPNGCTTTDIVQIIIEPCDEIVCDVNQAYCYFDYIVTGSEHWTIISNPGINICNSTSNIITIENELRIPPDTDLKIDGVTVLFGPNGKIVVDRGIIGTSIGGKLEVKSNSRLLPITDNCMWQGIQVWGTNNQNNLNSVQGFAKITDSEISYAHCAIYFGRRNNNLAPNINGYTGGQAEIIARNIFKDNYVGIWLPLGYPITFPTYMNIVDNEFLCEGSMRDPIYFGARSNYFININNRSSNIIYNGTNPSIATIRDNKFNNTPANASNSTIAIRCNSSRSIPFLNNEFIDVDRGIFFLSSNGIGIGNIVAESNYFENCNIGIYNLNNRSNRIYSTEMVNGINGISQGILNQFSVGSIIRENEIDDFTFGINVTRSGMNSILPLSIWQNEITNCTFSLASGGNNYYSQWLCNKLYNYNSGYAWSLFDIVNSGGGVFARIMPQGVCGIYPPANEFNITNLAIEDIFNSTLSNFNFEYNYRTSSGAIFYPQPVSSKVTVTDCSMVEDESRCGNLPPHFRLASSIIAQRDTTIDSTLVNILNSEIYNYYINVNEIDSAIMFIDTIHCEGINEVLIDLYFAKGNIDSIQAITNRLPRETHEEQDHIRYLTILHDLMEDSLTLFEMDSIQLATIAEIAIENNYVSYLCKAILNTIYDKPINYTCDIVNDCQEARIVNSESNIIVKSSRLINYPNPCTYITSIAIPSDAIGENNLTLVVYNNFGELVSDSHVNSNLEINFNCSGLSNGIYFYYLVSQDYKSPCGKMVVLKN